MYVMRETENSRALNSSRAKTDRPKHNKKRLRRLINGQANPPREIGDDDEGTMDDDTTEQDDDNDIDIESSISKIYH